MMTHLDLIGRRLRETPCLRILCAGDSITGGPAFPPGGYRGTLGKHLAATPIEFEFVGSKQTPGYEAANLFHEGHSGFSIRQLHFGGSTARTTAGPFDQTLATIRPDLVLLMIGTNDLYTRDPGECAAELADLGSMILRSESVPALFVGSIFPIRPGPKPWGGIVPSDVGQRVDEFNRLLSGLCKQWLDIGLPCEFVDHAHCSRTDDTHQDDGVHLTAAANDRLGESWFNAIRLHVATKTAK
jgi:lysophospholipase L1-like esterase